MKNNHNKVTVQYPNGITRVRNCQTTVRPTAAELGPVTDFNLWHMHLATVTDAQYGAYNRIDIICNTEMLVFDAHQILSQSVK